LLSAVGCVAPAEHARTRTCEFQQETDNRTQPDPLSIDRAAIETARRFTVAVQAIRPASNDDAASDLLTSEGPSEDSSDRPSRRHLRQIEGSGVVIDRAGLILTSHHVVHNASQLRIWSAGCAWQPAWLVGADPQRDLAVIAVDAELPVAAQFGDRHAQRLGEPVFAIGYTSGDPPSGHGTGPAVLTGRLIGLHRPLQGILSATQNRPYSDMLASTTPLQPGHSGGPLIDRQGRVIGINTAVITDLKSGRRTGYAVPVTGGVREIGKRIKQNRRR
jgi:S1-C subfamily serine protease